jgi:hypothetical protein
MIAGIIYFLLLCFLIYKTNFFGILKDDVLNNKFFLFAFLFKTSGIAVFYYVYSRFYGGIDYSDTFHYFQDSQVIYSVSEWDFSEFVKLMLGLVDDQTHGTYLFEHYIHLTAIWEKSSDEFLYNDNRLIIRMNVMIYFISFGSYFVHALISSLLSFLGMNWIYKTFKFLFPGKEMALFLVWLVFPGIWFWTSGLFKEGPALFLMGLALISAKRLMIDRRRGWKVYLMFAFGVLLSFMFKTYILLPLLFFTIVFFAIVFVYPVQRKILIYLSTILFAIIASSALLKVFFNKGPVEIISDRQKTFIDVSHGGIFLLAKDSSMFIRLPYDFKTITIDSTLFRPTANISKGASYAYCDPEKPQDTLYVQSNADTTTAYTFYYYIPKAHSSFEVPLINNSTSQFFKILPFSLYITLFKPLFYDARNALDIVDSIENLLILLSLLLLIINCIRQKVIDPWHIYFLSIVLSALMIIGITSPNMGAIERYRAIVVPFLFMSTLLSLNYNPLSVLDKFFKKPL